MKGFVYLVILLHLFPAGLAYGFKVNDFNFYAITPLAKPAVGKSYTDPVFGTTITRLTDAASFGPKTRRLWPGYPKHNIENADKTKMLVEAEHLGSNWNFFTADGPSRFISTLDPAIVGWGRAIDVRWDNHNPDIAYFTYGAKLQLYNIATGKYNVVFDFASYLARHWPNADGRNVAMAEEGDASDDRRYWAYKVHCRYGSSFVDDGVLVFDKQKLTVVAHFDRNSPIFGNYIGFTSVSPKGNWVWVGDSHRIYPLNLSSVRHIDFNHGHADFAISKEGYEVIVGNKWKSDAERYWIKFERLDTGESVWVCRNGGRADPEFHVSGNSHLRPGYAVISKYSPKNEFWGDQEIFLVEVRFDRPCNFVRLAHTRVAMKGYADAPFAKLNMDGTAVYFGTNWGRSFYDGGVIDLYRIDLTQDIYDALAAGTPSRTLRKKEKPSKHGAD